MELGSRNEVILSLSLRSGQSSCGDWVGSREGELN